MRECVGFFLIIFGYFDRRTRNIRFRSGLHGESEDIS